MIKKIFLSNIYNPIISTNVHNNKMQKINMNIEPDCFVKTSQVSFNGINYTKLEQAALDFAKKQHEGQFRKNPVKKIPYFTHCEFVAKKIKELGLGEDAVAAAAIHDTVEDTGATIKQISKMFNKRVAKFVYFITHSPNIEDWSEKQVSYLTRLKKAPIQSKAISAYDKIHNMNSDIEMLEQGINIFEHLGGNKFKQVEKYKKLLTEYEGNIPEKALKEYKETLKLYQAKVTEFMMEAA